MNTVKQLLSELKNKGSEQTRKTYLRHGAPKNMFGVKIADLKVIAKQIKGNQELAYQLYDTANVDAMYLAGIVADGKLMTKKLLNDWARAANWHMIAENTVPGVACESPFAKELAIKWINMKKPHIQSTGWCTYAGVVAMTEDKSLDLIEIKELLKRIEHEIDHADDRVKYSMNGFVISVGGYVKPLEKAAMATAKKLGKVEVDMGDTACKVPLATDYIQKMVKSGRAFKKRKTIKC